MTLLGDIRVMLGLKPKNVRTPEQILEDLRVQAEAAKTLLQQTAELLLVVGVMFAVLWIDKRWSWLVWAMAVVLIAAFVVHTIARVFHLLEKWSFRR